MHHIYVQKSLYFLVDNYSVKYINHTLCFLRQITRNIHSLIKSQTDDPTVPGAGADKRAGGAEEEIRALGRCVHNFQLSYTA